MLGGVGVEGQEYDDMYFSSSDRQKVSSKTKLSDQSTPLASTKYSAQGDYVYSEDSYSARTVNPEYIARYSGSETVSAEQPQTEYGSDDYYVAEETELVDPAEAYAQKIYGGNGSNYPVNRYSSFSSPFYSPYRASSFGRYSPYSRYSIYSPSSLYSPYSIYSPFYDPFYDPYLDPYGYGGGRSGFRTSIGFGYGFGSYYSPSSFGGYYCPSPYASGYNRGFGNGYYVGSSEAVAAVPTRTITQGARSSRTSVVSPTTTDVPNGPTRTRRSRYDQTSAAPGDAPINGRIAGDNRDYSSTQNEYVKVSRSNSGRVNRSSNRRNCDLAERAGLWMKDRLIVIISLASMVHG